MSLTRDWLLPIELFLLSAFYKTGHTYNEKYLLLSKCQRKELPAVPGVKAAAHEGGTSENCL